MAARKAELQQQLGEGEGVSSLIAASHDFAQHCGNQVRLSCGGGQMEIGILAIHLTKHCCCNWYGWF
jgi:hypothetical protein